jgi:hypothetical protein
VPLDEVDRVQRPLVAVVLDGDRLHEREPAGASRRAQVAKIGVEVLVPDRLDHSIDTSLS